MLDPLEPYSTRFWKRFIRDATAWARDNIIWGIIVLVAPPLVIYLRDPHANIDWVLIRTTLLLYGFAFAVYIIAHLCRVPEELDSDLVASLRTMDRERGTIEQELDERKRLPPKLDVRPLAVYRIVSDPQMNSGPNGERAWEIFLWARVELEEPITISILKYVLKLSLHGISQSSFDMRDDLDHWELTKWSPKTPTTYRPPGLAMQLLHGQPEEGWLHFSIPKASSRALDDSAIILIADTGHGAGYGETNVRPDMWNPDSNVRFGWRT